MILLVYIIVFLLPIATLEPSKELWFISLFDIVFIPLVIYWILDKIIKKKKIFSRTIFKHCLIILAIASVLSSILASNSQISFWGFLLMFRYYLFFQLLIDQLNTDDKIKKVIALFITGLIIVSVIGLIQGLLGSNFHIESTHPMSTNIQFSLGNRGYIRTIGTFYNSLNFAMYLSVGLFLILALKRVTIFHWIFLLCSLLIVITALLQTFSRGPILYALLCLVTYFLIIFRKKILLLAYIPLVILLISPQLNIQFNNIFFSDLLVDRFLMLENYENNVRYNIWLSVYERIGDNLFGVGYKNFNYQIDWPTVILRHENYLNDRAAGWNPFVFHFENVYLAVYMNLGFLGLLGFCALVGKMIIKPINLFKQATNDNLKNMTLILFIANLSFALNMFTNPAILSDFRIMLLFWFLMALVQVLNKKG